MSTQNDEDVSLDKSDAITPRLKCPSQAISMPKYPFIENTQTGIHGATLHPWTMDVHSSFLMNGFFSMDITMDIAWILLRIMLAKAHD